MSARKSPPHNLQVEVSLFVLRACVKIGAPPKKINKSNMVFCVPLNQPDKKGTLQKSHNHAHFLARLQHPQAFSFLFVGDQLEQRSAPGGGEDEKPRRIFWREDRRAGVFEGVDSPFLDCFWVGSLDFNFLGNQGVFH